MGPRAPSTDEIDMLFSGEPEPGAVASAPSVQIRPVMGLAPRIDIPPAIARQIAEEVAPESVKVAPEAELVAGDRDAVTISHLDEVKGLLDDAALLRKHSMRRNTRTGADEIFNATLFERSVARRQSILSAAVKLHREIWSQHAQQEFFQAVVVAIAKADRPTAFRLIEELRRINSPMTATAESAVVAPGMR